MDSSDEWQAGPASWSQRTEDKLGRDEFKKSAESGVAVKHPNL